MVRDDHILNFRPFETRERLFRRKEVVYMRQGCMRVEKERVLCQVGGANAKRPSVGLPLSWMCS